MNVKNYNLFRIKQYNLSMTFSIWNLFSMPMAGFLYIIWPHFFIEDEVENLHIDLLGGPYDPKVGYPMLLAES